MYSHYTEIFLEYIANMVPQKKKKLGLMIFFKVWAAVLKSFFLMGFLYRNILTDVILVSHQCTQGKAGDA